jgi:hypothetical protein
MRSIPSTSIRFADMVMFRWGVSYVSGRETTRHRGLWQNETQRDRNSWCRHSLWVRNGCAVFTFAFQERVTCAARFLVLSRDWRKMFERRKQKRHKHNKNSFRMQSRLWASLSSSVKLLSTCIIWQLKWSPPVRIMKHYWFLISLGWTVPVQNRLCIGSGKF